MVVDCIKAFNTSDAELALLILAKDKEVDNLKNKVFDELKNLMVKATDIEIIRRAVDLIFIAKSIERLGDHSTNISEDIIFMVHGKDIRHPRACIH
jgi:phosphate transport system protein